MHPPYLHYYICGFAKDAFSIVYQLLPWRYQINAINTLVIADNHA